MTRRSPSTVSGDEGAITMLRALIVLLLALFVPTSDPALAQQQSATTSGMPRFRHVEAQMKLSVAETPAMVRFIVDDAFPPWSYRDGETLKGLSIDIGDALCRELKIKCAFVVRPFDDARKALEAGEADAVLSGIAVTPETVATFDFTRPYLFGVGRFVERRGEDNGDGSDPFADGSAIAVAAGSAHEAFVKANFPDNQLLTFPTDAAALEAVKTNAAKTAFVDALRATYWMASPAAQNCCRFASGGYFAPAYFSRPVTIAVKKGNRQLLHALDYGLDRIDQSGVTGAIWKRYFPEGLL
jgi:polar amino acid transport system substrate-binding protein